MAGTPSPIILRPPEMQPVTGSPMGEALRTMGPQLIQFFLAKQQLELQERELALQDERLKLQEKEFKAQQTQQQASDQGQAAVLTGMAQTNPEVAQTMPGFAMGQDQIAQHLGQAQASGFDVNQLGNAALPSPGPIPGMTDISQFMPGQAPAQASNAALAAALPTIQSARQSEAAIEASKAQTRLSQQALAFQSRIQPIQLQLEASRLSLTEVELANAQQKIQLETRRFAQSLVNDQLRAAASYAASIAPIVGGLDAAKGEANRLFFGTNERPTPNALMTDAVNLLTQGLGQISDPAQLADFYEAQTKATFAERVGLSPTVQQTADRELARLGGDPQAAIRALTEDPSLSAEQKAAVLPGVVAYYQMLYPARKLKIPVEESGFRNLLKRVLTAAGSVGATGSPGVR